ncbi:hypothetical protein R1sor_010186 [Riccia sorocarpa]|uniref:Uncharacterized protein n=1 Tax=Riccia sorocarpa TaxID=122646 RepID=A0ABD3I185_9MARC
MGREDVVYVDAGGPAFFLNRSVSPASSCSSSFSNSEMKPRAMARSVGAQKNAARHRMTKQEYEMIVMYLENPDNFAAINGCEKKTKITWKTLTKVTAFGHMAVTLCAQGFVKCSGVIMGKKVARYVIGDAGLPAEIFFDDRDLCQDSQAAFQFSAGEPMLSGDEEEAADREEEPIDLSEDDEVDNQTGPIADAGGFFLRPPCLIPPPSERKTSLITAYEEQVKEKLVLRKKAQYQKASFRDTILEDRRQAREQRERARIHEGIEAMRRARADRRSTLLAEMVKTGKSMDEIHQYFLMLDSVEERLSGSM